VLWEQGCIYSSEIWRGGINNNNNKPKLEAQLKLTLPSSLLSLSHSSFLSLFVPILSEETPSPATSSRSSLARTGTLTLKLPVPVEGDLSRVRLVSSRLFYSPSGFPSLTFLSLSSSYTNSCLFRFSLSLSLSFLCSFLLHVFVVVLSFAFVPFVLSLSPFFRAIQSSPVHPSHLSSFFSFLSFFPLLT